MAPAVGVIGVGRLGEAIAEAVLAEPGQGPVHVTRRNAARVAALRRKDPRVRPADPASIVDACDIVIVALRPEDARALLPELHFGPQHRVISVMAEIPMAELLALTGDAGGVSRVLATPTVATGGRLLPVYPQSDAVDRIFGRRNTLLPLETEAQLVSLWAITGLLSTVMTVGDVAARWLVEAGIPSAAAAAYARALFHDVHAATAHGFAAGLDHVSTPGGLNVMMRRRLLDSGIEAHLCDGLDCVRNRLGAAATS